MFKNVLQEKNVHSLDPLQKKHRKKYSYHAFFFLVLSITDPMNMHRKLRSTTPANTGINMAYSCGRKYCWMKWSLSTKGWNINTRAKVNSRYIQGIQGGQQQVNIRNLRSQDANVLTKEAIRYEIYKHTHQKKKG